MKTNVLAYAAVAGLALCAGLLVAGPLSPPSGPVTSTYKTLTEIEPRIAINGMNTPGDSTCMFKVTQPGSYYLTGNVASGAGKTGIVINASQVTIDLNGYTISGGSTAISSGFSTSQIAIRHGNISTTSLHGIDLSSTSDASIDHVSVESVIGSGIATGAGSHVGDCRVVGGANAYNLSASCIIDRCIADNASGNGFRGGGECHLTDCVADSCAGMGFQFTTGNEHIAHCTANQSGTRGFDVGPYSLVESCVATGNNGIGFNMGTGSTIRGCTALNNTAQGIVALGGVNVVGNQIRYGPSGIAAIWLQGTQCRAEGNDITACGYGVFTSSTSHVITKNFVTGATTKAFQISVGNIVGTIVSAPTNGAVISGAAGGALLSSDPNANFVY